MGLRGNGPVEPPFKQSEGMIQGKWRERGVPVGMEVDLGAPPPAQAIASIQADVNIYQVLIRLIYEVRLRIHPPQEIGKELHVTAPQAHEKGPDLQAEATGRQSGLEVTF